MMQDNNKTQLKNNLLHNKPFFALAPMADVTDPAFRRIVATYGKPDILWTEFVSADGLMLGGRDHLLRDLVYTEAERPIIAQLFGSNVETMRSAAKLVAELGFDGIDINMGCPDKSIEKQGAGAALIKTPEIAVAIIRAAKAGIADAGTTIPLSVKTRIGYSKNEIETWIPTLLHEDIFMLTVHCRTRKELSSVPARWEHIAEGVALRNAIAPDTLIVGNGDVRDVADGQMLAKKYGADGVMIGRAIFGNPWLFANLPDRNTNQRDTQQHRINLKDAYTHEGILKKYATKIRDVYARFLQKVFGIKNRYWLRTRDTNTISREDRLRVLVEHCTLFEELLGDIKSFAIMKKHFKAYVYGWPGSKELRMKLMEATNTAEVARIISENTN